MDLQSFIIVKDYSEMVTVTAYFGGFNQVSQNMNFKIKDGLLFICGPKLQYLFRLSSMLSLTLHVSGYRFCGCEGGTLSSDVTLNS